MRLLKILTASVALSLAAASPGLAQIPPPAVLKVNPLKGNVYWVSGGVSNTGFVVGRNGVVVIDPQMTPVDAKSQLAEIAKITPKPVDQMIVTHADPDHVGGLPGYPAGTAIIAHENTRNIILAGAEDPSAGPEIAAMYKALLNRLPTRTLAGTETLTLDGVKIVLLHSGPAHSPADLAVYLPDQGVVFGSDLIVNTYEYPVIHDGGSSQGWIEAMRQLLALNAKTYIPGHGEILDKATLSQRLAKAEERRAAVKAMVYEGKTLQQVKAALPEFQPNERFPSFTEVVFYEISEGYPKARSPWAALMEKKK